MLGFRFAGRGPHAPLVEWHQRDGKAASHRVGEVSIPRQRNEGTAGFLFLHAGFHANLAGLGRSGPILSRDRGSHRLSEHPCTERSEEHTSELQSLMRISYAVYSLKK